MIAVVVGDVIERVVVIGGGVTVMLEVIGGIEIV